MALNMLGLGFVLGAQDKGLGKQIKSVTSGLTGISAAVLGIGAASAKMGLGTAINGARGLASALGNLASDTKLNTTFMEAYGVQANKVTSAGLAGLNLTTKEFRRAKKQLASIAFGMNADVGAVTASYVAMEQAGIRATDLGFKSFKQFSKFIQVTGADAGRLASAFGVMNKQMGLNEKQMSDVMKSTVAIGKRFGIGREAVDSMSAQTLAFNKNLGLLEKGFRDNKDAQIKFIKGTTVVAGAMTELGFAPDAAIAASQKLSDTLLKGRQNFKDIYAGLAEDFGPASKVLTENFGGVDKAFTMLQDSPEEFTATLGKAWSDVAKLKDPAALNRFEQQIGKTFGPEMLRTVQNYDQIADSLKAGEKPIKGQDQVLDDLAKKYSDGRTMAERFALAEDQLATSLKRVKGVMSDSEYLDNYRRQTKLAADEVAKLAEKGGPVGTLTTTLIELRERGFGGVIGGLHPLGHAFFSLTKYIQPVIGALPGLAAGFSILMSPVTLLAAAVGGLVFAFRDLGKTDSIIRPMVDRVKQQMPELMENVTGMVKGAFQALGDGLMWMVDNIPWAKIGETLGHMAAQAFDAMLRIALKLTDLGLRLADWFVSIDWAKVGKTLGDLLAKALFVAVEIAVKVLVRLPVLLYKAFVGAFDLINGLIDGFFDNMKERFPKIAILLEGVRMALKGIVMIVKGALIVGFSVLAVVAAKAGIAMMVALAPVIIAYAKLGLIVAGVGLAVYGIWKAFKFVFKNIKKIAKGFLKVITWPFRMAWKGIKKIFHMVRGIWMELYDNVGKGAKRAMRMIAAPFNFLARQIKRVAGAISGVIDGIGGGLSRAGRAIGRFFGTYKEKTESATGAMIEGMAAAGIEAAKAVGKTAGASEAAIRRAQQASIAAGTHVRTTKGEVIRASDAAVRYVQTATGEVQKIVQEASSLRFGQITTGLDKEVDKAREIVGRLRGEGLPNMMANMFRTDEARMNEAEQAIKDFRERTGTDPRQLARVAEHGRKAVSAEHEALAGLSAAAQAVVVKNLNHSAQVMERKWIALEREKTNISGREAMRRRAQLREEQAAHNRAIDEQIAVLSGDWVKAYEESAARAGGQMAFMARMAKLTSDRFRQESAVILADIPAKATAAKAEAARILEDMAKARTIELQKLSEQTGLTAEQVKAKADEIDKKYAGLAANISKQIGRASADLQQGIDKGFVGFLNNMRAGLGGVLEEAAVKGKETASEIEKALGVTSDTAAGMVDTIANLKPKRFKRNLMVVQKSMDKFLKKFVEKITVTFNKLIESINKTWETLQKGWDDQAEKVGEYAGRVEIELERVTSAMHDGFAEWMRQLVGLIASAVSATRMVLGRHNIMNLLASNADIQSWSNRVVLTLAQSLRTGNFASMAIAATEQEFARLINMAQDGGAEAAAPAAAPSSRINAGARDRIVDVLNSPDWTVTHTANQEAMLHVLGEIATRVGAPAGPVTTSTPEQVGPGPSTDGI